MRGKDVGGFTLMRPVTVPELKKFVRIRVTARGLKTINKHGAYKALKKAGAI